MKEFPTSGRVVDERLERMREGPRQEAISKDGTTVPSAPRIVDVYGVGWSLSHEVEHGGNIVLRDGKRFGGAGVKLIWSGGKLYLQNMPGAWFVLVGEGWTASWAQTSDPTVK
jgi:hypothetical protein